MPQVNELSWMILSLTYTLILMTFLIIYNLSYLLCCKKNLLFNMYIFNFHL